jgi:hypothetical protein
MFRFARFKVPVQRDVHTGINTRSRSSRDHFAPTIMGFGFDPGVSPPSGASLALGDRSGSVPLLV